MSKILLIEPDFLLSKIYKQALADFGHEVACAATAQSAINKADGLQPDLVILELQLVEHSGIEFLYEFRSYIDWQKIPVIIQTQVPEIEFAQNRVLLSDELGVVDYLYKPETTLEALLRSVTKQLKVIA